MAESVCREVLKASPQNLDASHILGVVLQQSGQTDEAVEILSRVVDQQPDNPHALFNYANCLRSGQRQTEAKTYYEKCLAINPNWVEVLNSLGNVAQDSGQYETAVEYFHQGIRLASDNAILRYNLGQALDKMGQVDAALAAYRQALSIDASFSLAFYEIGNLEATKGRHEAALKAYTSALRLNPKFIDAQNNIGNVLLDQLKVDEAIAAFRQARDLDPSYLQAHHNLGNALTTKGLHAEAAKSYAAGHQISPKNPLLLVGLGNALRLSDNFDSAREAYEKALSLNPHYFDAINSLGNLHLQLGETEKALEMYEKAGALRPDNQEVQHLLSALKGDSTEHAPAEYVRRLFDQYADSFETHLVETLEYKTPSLLLELLRNHNPDYVVGHALDLGCGTGLVGKLFDEHCTLITGVDLSEKSIEIAKAKEIYDFLHVSDISNFLNASQHSYDLVIAADVFVYLGELETVLTGIARCMEPKGLLMFSTEHLATGRYQLLTTGRYAHSVDYVDSTCERLGFTSVDRQRTTIRKERGEEIAGDLYLFRR